MVKDGLVFDSNKEYQRWMELRLMERAGEISGLSRQVRYELIPAQREPDIIGPKGGRRPGKLIERSVDYVADFVYTKDGTVVVEDTKGYKGGQAYALFAIKRKLMLQVWGIKVREV